MKKILAILMMAMMTISVSAQKSNNELNEAAQTVMKILEGKQWAFIAESANLANSIAVDRMAKDRNYFNCKGDLIDVKIDFFGADVRNTGVTRHSARRMANDLRSTGNTLATLPPMYEATYKIIKQEVTSDKKGKNITARISYSVEDSNVSNMGSTPELVIRVKVKDMSTSVSFEGFRSGETYYGTLLEKQVIK